MPTQIVRAEFGFFHLGDCWAIVLLMDLFHIMYPKGNSKKLTAICLMTLQNKIFTDLVWAGTQVAS